jgi:YesN/AraC family two-component response regulator
MKKILIIDDEKPVRDVLNIALCEEGYESLQAPSGEQGIELFKSNDPDIVITDVMMPGIDGIEVTKRMRAHRDDIDVVVMSGFGTEELVVNALRAGASNYIKKPIVFDELFKILDDIIFKRENRKRFEISREIVEREHKSIVIGNDVSKVWGAVNQILFNVQAAIDNVSLEGICIGLYELLINAIEHGNLGITFQEKSDALQNSTYTELLKSRMQQADTDGKVVRIESDYTPSSVTITIRDQGSGFDLSNLPNMKDAGSLLLDHGRGILLANLFYDSLEYDEPGNCVRISKTIDRS